MKLLWIIVLSAILAACGGSSNGSDNSNHDNSTGGNGNTDNSDNSDNPDNSDESNDDDDSTDDPDDQDAGLGSRTGFFVDAPVENLNYETETESGRTNAAGEYSYKDGETVVFSIGDIQFPAVTARQTVTPLSVFETADIEDTRVINLARLLQSLDTDQDPSAGIEIPDNAYENATGLDLDFASESFDEDVASLVESSDGMGALITAESALTHLKSELSTISQCESNTFRITGIDYVIPEGAGTVVHSKTALSGELEIDEDSCQLTDNVEGYTGSCELNGSKITVSVTDDFSFDGTVSGNTFSGATDVTLNEEDNEYVTAHFSGLAENYCEPATIAVGEYSLAGMESSLSYIDDKSNQAHYSHYAITGTFTVTEDGGCYAVTSEGDWPAESCEIKGNEVVVFDGILRGTIGPDSLTVLYKSPRDEDNEEFFGYFRGSRQ